MVPDWTEIQLKISKEISGGQILHLDFTPVLLVENAQFPKKKKNDLINKMIKICITQIYVCQAQKVHRCTGINRNI